VTFLERTNGDRRARGGRGGRFSSGMDLLFKSRWCFYFYIDLLRAII
jgi:hypothetical protein